MPRSCILLLLSTLAFAQTPPATPEPVPPDVDAALRQRVAEFFQLQIDNKARKALDLVAEESKDYFFDAAKPTYLSFKIKSIDYSDHFTRAVVHMMVDRIVHMPGFEGHPMHSALPSAWKIEDGKWCWYARTEDMRRTPFGTIPNVKGAPPSFSGAPPGMPSQMSQPPSMLPPSLSQPGVRTTKTGVQLKSAEPSSDQITLFNASGSAVKLSVADPLIPGFAVKLDRDKLQGGEKAILTVSTSIGNQKWPENLALRVMVEPSGQVIPLRVTFVAPAAKAK